MIVKVIQRKEISRGSCRNNFITPKIMKETVGLNPIITILTIAVGAKLAGIGGALLAVPVYLTIETITTVLVKKD